MRPSRYNWLFQHEGRTVLFNGASGHVAEIEEHSRHVVSEALASDEPLSALSRMEPGLRSRLVDGGFFVSRDSNELHGLREVSRLPLRIAPISTATAVVTTRCNFDCRGCLLDTSCGRDMTQDTVDRLVEAIASARASVFSLELSGGEPLLVPGICMDAAARASKACARNGGKLKVGLITNGYLLDKQMARRMAGAGVTRACITLVPHQICSPTKGDQAAGEGTLSWILDNAFEAAGHLAVVISIPAGWRRAGETERRLRRMLRGCGNVAVRRTGGETGEAGTATCLGDPGRLAPEDGDSRLSRRSRGPCSFVLMPDGSFALCWSVPVSGRPAGDGLPVGEQADGSCALRSWTAWRPYDQAPCRECRHLPTCAGGCPSSWLQTGSHQCAFSSDEDYIRFVRGAFLG